MRGTPGTCKDHSSTITEQRPLPKTREMLIHAKVSQVPWHYHQYARNSVKLKGLVDWLQPTTVMEVQSFLRFGNFYKLFIQDYTKIA